MDTQNISATNDETFYGACGAEGCTECLPRFDGQNNPCAVEWRDAE